MKTRYMMTAKTGEHTESASRASLVKLRSSDIRFKYARIHHRCQAWDDVVLLDVIYPERVISRSNFRDFNES